jgi:hypothetical protein
MGTLPVVFCSAKDPSSGTRRLMDLVPQAPRHLTLSTLATEVFAAGAAGLVIQGIRRSRWVRHSGRT